MPSFLCFFFFFAFLRYSPVLLLLDNVGWCSSLSLPLLPIHSCFFFAAEKWKSLLFLPFLSLRLSSFHCRSPLRLALIICVLLWCAMDILTYKGTWTRPHTNTNRRMSLVRFSIKTFAFYRFSLRQLPLFFSRRLWTDTNLCLWSMSEIDRHWLLDSTMWRKIKEILCKHTGELPLSCFCLLREYRHAQLFGLMMMMMHLVWVQYIDCMCSW